MSKVKRSPVLRFLDNMACEPKAMGCSDSELLSRFAQREDAIAFSVLLHRHAPMVLQVCERALGNEHDAEDAFQATFLILARKAVSIRQSGSVASWLYGVALRTAKNLKRAKAIQRKQEAQAPPAQACEPSTELLWNEIRPILDCEISHLPNRYRQPVILCYLEGRTNDEAAEELGCTRGTIAGRLARARDLLRQRLTRRGISLSSAALATLITQQASAAPSPELLASTVSAVRLLPNKELLSQTVLQLFNQGLKQMTISKIVNIAVAALLLSLFAGGAIVMAQGDRAPKDRPLGVKQKPKDPTKDGNRMQWEKVAEMKGHEERDDIWVVAFSPDGKTLASGSEDKSIILWDVKTGRQRVTMKAHTDEVVSIAFSPDGKRLVSAGWDNLVHVWDVRTGKLLIAIRGHKGRVESVAFSPDGTLIATGGWDGSIGLWKGATGQQIARFKGGQQAKVLSLVFSPDGRLLASGSSDEIIRVLDPQRQMEIARIKADIDDLRGLCFSPDGKWLASCTDGDVVTLWNTKQFKAEIQMKESHTSKIYSMAFHPTGKFLATGSGDKSVRFWDLEKKKQVGILQLDDRILGLDFSPDGKLLATATDAIITLWKRK